MRIALAQYTVSTDVLQNLSKVQHFMHEASQQNAQLIVFPELCLSPFFPQHAGRDASGYATTLDSDYIQQLKSSCRELRLVALPNIYLRVDQRCFDASLLIDSAGAITGISKMVHIAQLPGFYERDYYSPSDTGFNVYHTPLGKIGIVVCFDRHYPESTRTCALRGAQLIVVPTANTKSEPRDLFECELRTAAMQNGVFIAMCNRVGNESGTEFCGESTVVNSDGDVVFKAGDTEGLYLVDIDLSAIELSRSKRPYIALRRPETYE